jgi:hypothetical protein
MQIPFSVHNPNYYDIKLKTINLEVDYDGLFLGNMIQNGGMTFSKRATTVSKGKEKGKERKGESRGMKRR